MYISYIEDPISTFPKHIIDIQKEQMSDWLGKSPSEIM